MAFLLDKTSGKGNQVITVTAEQNDGIALSRTLTVRTNGGVVRTVMLTQKALRKMIRITTENNAHTPFTVTLKKLYFKPNIVKPINVSMSSTNGEDTKDFDVSEALSDVTIILGEKPIQADWEVTPKFSGIVFIYYNNRVITNTDSAIGTCTFNITNDKEFQYIVDDKKSLIGYDMGIIGISNYSEGAGDLDFNDIVDNTPSLFWQGDFWTISHWDKTGEPDNYVLMARVNNASLSFNFKDALADSYNTHQATYGFTFNMAECSGFNYVVNCEEFSTGDGDYISVTLHKSTKNERKFYVGVTFRPMDDKDMIENSPEIFSLDSDITMNYNAEELNVSDADGSVWTYKIDGIGDNYNSPTFYFPIGAKLIDAHVIIP